MAVPADKDQQWLVDCLGASLHNSHDVRSFAEASLHQASLQPGFGAALSKVAVNRDVPFGLRQLSAVLLKQFIKQHWKDDEESFVPPVVSPEEKVLVRQFLLSSLDDPHGKLRTAIGMATASIASYDWPEEWPELLPLLLNLIHDQKNINGVRGALRCLALISGDLDDTTVPKLIPVLFPPLLKIVSSPNIFEKSLCAKAISIVHSCTSILGSMSGVYKTEIRSLMLPMVKLWMEQFSIILQSPVRSEDPDDWSIKMEILKCLIQFIQNFPSLAQAEFLELLSPLWQTLVSCKEVYQLSLIEGVQDPYLERFDSEGTEKSLETLAIQLFEFLLTFIGKSKFAKVMEANTAELIYHTISFMQITTDQMHAWITDANKYVADEDDATYSCRVSGSLLLEEVANAYGGKGIDSLIGAVQKHYMESCQAKAAGSKDWWRVLEASLFALCSVSDLLLEAQESELSRINIVEFLNQIQSEDAGVGVLKYPFLHARIFAAVSKFSIKVNQNLCERFLYAAIEAVAGDATAPVKVGACQALSQLLPHSNSEFLQRHMMGLFSALSELLNQASEETLHLVLETFQSAVKSGHDLSASIEPLISPIILNVWVKYVSDPFISIDALEVLEAIKNSPGCMQPLICRILPSVGHIIERPHQQPVGLVAGSLDLLTMLLRNAPSDVGRAMFDLCFDSVVRIILQSDDHSEMQNATECLGAFITCGKEELLAWSANSGSTMKSLLDATSRLLNPDLESSSSLFVGTYVLLLILHFPSEMALHIPELVAALVRRMQSCEIAGVKSSIIVILARLIHLSSPNSEQFINLLISVQIRGCQNSLAYVMSEWTKLQGEIQGSYQIKVTTTALALLLSSRHNELAKINVQGQPIKSSTGIVTRSKSKVAPDQWTTIPLPSKIFALLSDTLIEIQEQVLADATDDDDDDEDSDWEEFQETNEGVHQNIIVSTSLSTDSRPSADHLQAMARVFNGSDGDNDYEDDFIKGSDPLNEINLLEYLVGFFENFLLADKYLFDQLFQRLSEPQKTAINAVMRK